MVAQAIKWHLDNPRLNIWDMPIIDPKMPTITGTSYYVDASTAGTEVGTIENPFRTIAQANAQILSAGDALLFKKGETWVGRLIPNGVGTDEDRIVIGSYGDGEKPIITQMEDRTYAWTDTGSDNLWTCDNPPTYDPKRIWKDGLEILRAESVEELGTNVPTLVEWWYTTSTLTMYSLTDPNLNNFAHAGDSPALYTTEDYVTIYGIDFQGKRAELYSSTGVLFSYCNFGYNSSDGMYITGGTLAEPRLNLTIDSCVIDSGWTLDYHIPGLSLSTQRGTFNGINIKDSWDGIVISNNYFKDWGHADCIIAPQNDDEIQNVLIEHNTNQSPNMFYGGGFQIMGIVHNFEIRYNKQYNSTGRLQIEGSYMHIHHNVWEDMRLSPLKDYGATGYGIRFGDFYNLSHDNIIENNIFNRVKAGGMSIGATHYFTDGQGMRDMTIQNNIFVDCFDITPEGNAYLSSPIALTNFTFDTLNEKIFIYNNISYYTGEATQWFGTVNVDGRLDLADFETAVNSEGNGSIASGNIVADILLNTEYGLSSGSPAIGTGLSPTSTVDYEGNSIIQGSTGTGYDMGIYDQFKLRTAYSIKVTLPDGTVYIYTDDRAGDRHLYMDDIEQAKPDEIIGSLTMEYVSQLTGGNITERSKYEIYNSIITP